LIATGRAIALRLPEPELEPGEARRIADDVLSDPVYRQTEPLFDRALRIIGEAFGRILGELTSGDAGSIIAWLVLGAAIGALVLLLRNAFGPLPRFTRPAPVEIRIIGEPVDQRNGATWRAEADRLAAAQAWDEAIRARYRGVVVDLIAAGTLDGIAGTTPGEHRRRLLADGGAGAETFAELTDLFELVWYGPVDAGPEDLESFRRREAMLLAPVGAQP